MLRPLYSQSGQDLWVIRDVFDYRRGGTFLDIGAAGGVELSNSYALERYWGWKGLCVEADGDNFQKLKATRSCQLANVCLDERPGEVLFSRKGGFFGGIVENANDSESGDVVRVPALPLSDLLEKNQLPTTIDYLSLDVEGAEDRVMAGFPFETHRFLAATIERPSPALRKKLADHGYLLVVEWPNNDVHYLHASLATSYTVRAKIRAAERTSGLAGRVWGKLKFLGSHGLRSAWNRR